jgi:hypothetical protein
LQGYNTDVWADGQVGVEDEVPFTVRSLRRAAKNGYGDMISSYCENLPAWLVTITHGKQNTHPEFSIKMRSRWLHHLNKKVFGSNYSRRGEGFRSFFGLEFQEKRAAMYGGRATVHQHGVVAGHGLGSVRRDEQKFLLQELSRGWCRVEVPRHPVNAIRYCAKYAAKEGELDIWLPGSVLNCFRGGSL